LDASHGAGLSCGGEISSEFASRDSWQTSPTLILVAAFIQRNTKVETRKDSASFEIPGILNFYFYPFF
jgi:hypothetical protein